MEYQLVCYNAVPLAEAPLRSPHHDMIMNLIRAMGPGVNPHDASSRRRSCQLPGNVKLYLDFRPPIACALVCQASPSCQDTAHHMLEAMHARVSSINEPSTPFEHQHTLGILLPNLISQRRSDSSEKLAMQAELMDSLQSNDSAFGAWSSDTTRCFGEDGTCTVWYMAAWLAAVFMACVVIFLGVAAWIYFRDYF